MTKRTFKELMVGGAPARVLEDGDPVGLACGTGGCERNCCLNGPPIVLNPYEVGRLCAAGGTSYEDLLDVLETERANGFPLVLLPREPACHFWTARGCSVYADRPLACRLFPLGRVFEDGRSHLVLPERNRCSGLDPAPAGTLADYLGGQGTAVFLEMADRWIEFVTRIEEMGLPDRPVTSVAFHLLVYSPDTPPAPGGGAAGTTPEERFLLRLETARRRLPGFLNIA